MRIVAGQFRGRTLTALGKGDESARLRPTTDRVRESLFNVLAHRHPLEGARVLDLFAGTGALGLESLSRGATHVTAIENGPIGARLIARNIALLQVGDRMRLMNRDATRLGTCDGGAFDLVFLDPPYGRGLGERALSSIAANGWLAPGATIIWEEIAPMAAPPGFELLDTRRYGDTHATMLRYGEAPDHA